MTTDHQIKQDVATELAWGPSLMADPIGATAENGVVSLSGHVETFWQKQAAERAAGRVEGVHAPMGVTGLTNQITIRPRVDGPAVAEGIRHALHRSCLYDDAIEVRVEGGTVHLIETVESWLDRDLSADAARAAKGTAGVTNDIVVA